MKGEQSTEDLLKELRNEGKIPYSACATYCAATFAVLVSSLFMIPLYFERSRAFLREEFDLSDWLSPLGGALALPICAGIFSALLVGTLQTRWFLFIRTPERVREIYGEGVGILTFLFSCIAVVCGVLITGVSWVILVKTSGPVLMHDAQYLPHWSHYSACALVAIVCVLLGGIGVISWFVARALFVMKFKGSR